MLFDITRRVRYYYSNKPDASTASRRYHGQINITTATQSASTPRTQPSRRSVRYIYSLPRYMADHSDRRLVAGPRNDLRAVLGTICAAGAPLRSVVNCQNTSRHFGRRPGPTRYRFSLLRVSVMRS